MIKQLQGPVGLAQRRLRPGVAATCENYRLSRYALAFPRPAECQKDSPDALRLHNLVTGELVSLDADDALRLQGLPAPYAPWMDGLIAGHFLVPTGFNEREWVDFLRHAVHSWQGTHRPIPSFVVMPTSACNARCAYCFEQGVETASMTPEVERQTVGYIAQLARKAHIVWYGGEPLLGAAAITRICEGLQAAGIQWESHILTNAYLADEGLAQRMRDVWHVEKALVTLDGTEAEYNRVKAYVNAQGSPFKRVMRNIGLLMDAGIQVHIRLHLAEGNYDDLCALVPVLAGSFAERERISVHVSIVNTLHGHGRTEKRYPQETLARLHEQRNALIGRIKDTGLASSHAVVGLRMSSCINAAPNSVIINPQGGLSRCYKDTTATSGSIFDAPAAFPPPTTSVLRIAECDDCVLYPDCQRNSRCHTGCSPAARQGRIAQIRADAWRS